MPFNVDLTLLFRAFAGNNESPSKTVMNNVKGLHPDMDKDDIESMFSLLLLAKSKTPVHINFGKVKK